MAQAEASALRSAVEDFSEAIKLEPHFSNAFAGRCTAVFKLDQSAAALADCDRAVALNPNNLAAYRSRAEFTTDWDVTRRRSAIGPNACEFAPEIRLRSASGRWCSPISEC